MSLALIQESAKEVRRLAIAGSPLAVGDFRLKKLVAPLEQAGAKVPVFGQVAKAISDLVNGSEAESAANLLGLSTLLNAVLYTQGQTGAEGDYRQMETFATACSSTRTTARVLRPLIDALTTKGAERFKEVKAAVERGAFNDLRLVEPAIRALDDSYSELADLVAEKVIPTYGPGVAPLLKQKLDLKGKKGDARRLALLHQLDPVGTLDLCRTALDDGSPEVKAAAVACLGRHEECLPLVLEQSKSKNKVVRAAALEALAAHDRPEIISLFTELLKGKTLDILAGPFRAMRSRQVLNALLAEGRRILDLLAKGDASESPRFWEILDCLAQREDAAGEEFLLAVCEKADPIAKLKAPKGSTFAGADLLARVATLLYHLGSAKALEMVLAKRAVLPPAVFSLVIRSALRTWSPEAVFVEFSPMLEQKKGAGKERAETLQLTVLGSQGGDLDVFYEFDQSEVLSAEAQALKQAVWDPRWVPAAIKFDRPLIVCCLAQPGDKGAMDYLLRQLDDKKQQFQLGRMLGALARCQYPKLTDVFLELVTKRTEKATYFDYELQELFASARHLPASDLPRLDAFAATLDEKFVDRFLEAIGPLRTAK